MHRQILPFLFIKKPTLLESTDGEVSIVWSTYIGSNLQYLQREFQWYPAPLLRSIASTLLIVHISSQGMRNTGDILRWMCLGIVLIPRRLWHIRVNRTIGDDNDLDGISNCTTIFGSLHLQIQGDNTTEPTLQLSELLTTVTGGLLCSGMAVNYSPNAIEALGLNRIASDQSDSSNQNTGLVISDYQNLTTLKFPSLTYIGSNFVIARNPNTSAIEGFQSLITVAGNLDITGTFDSFALPNIAFVGGNFNVQSSSKIFQCPDINRTVVHGTKFVCAGNVTNPQPLVADNSTTNTTIPTITSSSAPSSTRGGTAASSSHSGSSGSASRMRTSHNLQQIEYWHEYTTQFRVAFVEMVNSSEIKLYKIEKWYININFE